MRRMLHRPRCCHDCRDGVTPRWLYLHNAREGGYSADLFMRPLELRP